MFSPRCIGRLGQSLSSDLAYQCTLEKLNHRMWDPSKYFNSFLGTLYMQKKSFFFYWVSVFMLRQENEDRLVHTVLLYYCTTVLLYYCTTELLNYCITVLLYYCITVLLYYCITLLLYYCNTVLLYYCITVLLYYSITVLLYYCIIIV